ncbi:flagellar hook-basal body protein [Entomospira entomophila]|uniref:Flagellar hook-basal body protein n=1 Tax=Entomospira entomophila TaxID=2719988 RepID=A0A968KTM5_9SPIO|nr:flagellar hook-basal body protein [Entomospira entomophilus]NIZ40471.1 flagellar hook-basal body protein [Entomospira entomophilus]WDI36029.1 flagellar hook-basal body protein [Entomospira entomophilus]
MVRGLYIGASGMQANENRMNVVANNLANVDLTGYKKDVSVLKSFPEMLIQRSHDNGVVKLPIGSYDSSPIVGKLGTGVEYNETFTAFEQGSLKQTENAFDLALANNDDTIARGFFVIETPQGERYTRNGTFILGKEGYLETKDGYRVLGENGPIQVKLHNFVVGKDGTIYHNQAIEDDPRVLTSARENDWAEREIVDRLRIVHFYDTMDQPAERYLAKVGNSMWSATELSGPAVDLEEKRPQVLQGFLEASSVNAVQEMVTMITVNRAYEASQKTIQSADNAIEQAISKVLRA